MQVFLRNSLVLERMAQVATIVFDKTGTLTAPQATELSFYAPANGAAGLTSRSSAGSERWRGNPHIRIQ